jgi:hypothetical protein
LDSLDYHGGPTLVHSIKKYSIAIDAGCDAGFTEDQRGSVRPFDFDGKINICNGIDIGAFELTHKDAEPPSIQLSRDTINIGYCTSGDKTPTQTFWVINAGGGNLNWFISDESWLKCLPYTGINNAEISVTLEDSVAELSPGIHSGVIRVQNWNDMYTYYEIIVTLTVYPAFGLSAPIGYFDTPISGTAVSGSLPVTGWAVDDLGIQSLKIYRDPIQGEGSGLIYIGDAVFVEGARPDIEEMYNTYPYCHKAGWGYMLLTNFLPNKGNGSFILHAIAEDFEGNRTSLGTKTIICDNANAVKPFGAIDTPGQGGTASGNAFVNFGWALTPQPNTIPFNGSTITVFLDGIPKGHPVYNQPRQDIINLFPGYNNTNGAVGYFYLDTTKLENGVHTIAWSVTDDADNIEGIGSRYFNVNNSSNRIASTNIYQINAAKIPINLKAPVFFKRGFRLPVHPQNWQTLYPDENGNITANIKELDLLEICFFPPSEIQGSNPDDFNKFTLRALSSLPIGSSIDPKSGIFRWQVGPGFIGQYEFEFLLTSGGGKYSKRKIRVCIHPMGHH